MWGKQTHELVKMNWEGVLWGCGEKRSLVRSLWSGLIREKETDEDILGKENCRPKSQLGRSLVVGSTWFDVDLPRRQGSWRRMKGEVREEERTGREIKPSSPRAQDLTMEGEVFSRL